MSILPLGSSGGQWRPVLSCEPEPLTVPSFCATWKSIVQGRNACATLRSASSQDVGRLTSHNPAGRTRSRESCSPAYKAWCAPCRPESQASWGDPTCSRSSTMCFQPCMPPQQISPSAASRSPYPSATVQASRNVPAMRFVFAAGFSAQGPGPARRSQCAQLRTSNAEVSKLACRWRKLYEPG